MDQPDLLLALEVKIRTSKPNLRSSSAQGTIREAAAAGTGKYSELTILTAVTNR